MINRDAKPFPTYTPGGALRYKGGGRTRVTYFAEEGVFFEDLRMSAIL